jgi:predicted transposase YbfD/YdcC
MGHYDGWRGLRTVVMVERERRIADKVQVERAYYLSILSADAERILNVTRAHWSVENTFHWTMDMIFGESASRVRLDEAPENRAVVRHIALNLLKQHPAKISIKRKRFRTALDDGPRTQQELVKGSHHGRFHVGTDFGDEFNCMVLHQLIGQGLRQTALKEPVENGGKFTLFCYNVSNLEFSPIAFTPGLTVLSHSRYSLHPFPTR